MGNELSSAAATMELVTIHMIIQKVLDDGSANVTIHVHDVGVAQRLVVRELKAVAQVEPEHG